jgi:hypothetical protein
MSCIHIIHENREWTEPLKAQLHRLGLPFQEWYLDHGELDLSAPPPPGVFYNRMSASSHTRNHRYAAEYAAAVLSWLEGHDRRVINSGRALQLEISKVAQYAVLGSHGIRTPRTVAAIGREHILSAAESFDGPFITKHNRGGKGLGVSLFQNSGALREYVDGPGFERPIDGITLIQQYIEAPRPFITRCEFVGGKFLYAVRADTSDGFLLCPADECQVEDEFCPTAAESKFRILKGFDHPILERYRRFLDDNRIHVAGIEFIVDKVGDLYTYDVNTNTNYNPAAESEAGVSGMRRIAEYLGEQLAEITRSGVVRRAATA